MELIKILKRLHNKYRTNQIIFSFSLVFSAFLFLILLVIGFFFSRLLLLLLLPFIAVVIYKSGFFDTLITLSQKIEKYFPEIKGKLVPVVELCQRFKLNTKQTKEGYSNELIDAAITQTTGKIQRLHLDKIVNYQKTIYSVITCFILLASLISVRIFFKENFRLGWYWVFNPQKMPLKLDISPGDIYVNKDSIVRISYNIDIPVKTLRVMFIANQKKFINRNYSSTIDIKADKEISYFVSVQSNLGFTIKKSPDYHIRLNQPIEISDLVFTYQYPTYTKFYSTQSRGSDIKAIKGTKVEYKGTATMPLSFAFRVSGTGKTETLAIHNNELQGNFVISKEDSFTIYLTGQNHRQGKSQTYYVMPSIDEIPFVKMFMPGRDIDIPVNMQALIGMYGLDDFGVTRFDLCYIKPTTSETMRMILRSGLSKTEDTLFYLWNLTKLNILPGEAIGYYGVVYDNDIISGYKNAQSETYTIRFPTLTEIYDQTTQENRATMEKLGPITETQEQLSKELQKITEHIQQYRSMDWEEKSKLNQLLAKQEEIMSDISALQEQINNTLTDLHSGLMLDKETVERLREIGQLLSEILPEEMKQRLEQLQQALSEKNPELSKALENFKMSVEEMKEALKRALELLKNIQKQEELVNLARKAEEIYKQQSQLNARMNEEKLDKLVNPQEQIGNEIQDLQNEINKVSKNFDDSITKAQLAEIVKELNEMQLPEQVGNVSKNLSQGKRADSKKSANELLQDLHRLKDQLKELADKFKQSQNQELTENLLRVASDLNQISQEQEIIKTHDDKQHLSDLVIRQKRLSEATTVVAESLSALSERSLLVSPNWTKEIVKSKSTMDSTSQLLEDAVYKIAIIQQAQQLQEQAIFKLDVVTLQILLLVLQGQKSGGMPSGMESLLQALCQLTADQMTLGQQMGGMIPMPIPGGLSPDQMSQLARLMSLQSQLRTQLEQLMKEIQSGQYGEVPGMTGSMQGALEEMKQIEKDLAEQIVNRQTIERQEQVINRLLDAQRSIRQKEYSEKREREIGKDYPDRPRIMLDKNLGETKKLLREELLRALREGYPKEYEDMIKHYFESIIQE
jgi:hypothetical protein